MTFISNISGLRPTARYPDVALDRKAAVNTDKLAPSTIVSLSSKGLQAAENAESDATLRHVPASARFYKVGSNLLENFGTHTLEVENQLALPVLLDNEFTLGIVTNGNAQVALTIANVGEDMFIHINSSAELNPNEREAVASLAQAFQSAIDGLTKDEPQVRLAELAQFDTRFLQSVDLHAKVSLVTVPPATQSLDFHIDSKQRKVTIDGPVGKIELGVETTTLQGLSTSQQQAKAIESYLKKFDQVGQRGQGNPHLITMFKDAFSDMVRVSKKDDVNGSGATTFIPWKPSREDKAVLTGLPDFSANVSQAPRWSNPLRQDETDSFDYEVSQDTRLTGQSFENRSITQVQKSRLSAQFHTEPTNDRKLKLNIAAADLNYRYHQIDDSASSMVELGYSDGRLMKAHLQQSVFQSERIREYVMGKITSDHTTSGEQQLVRDLVASLSPNRSGPGRILKDEAIESAAEWRQSFLDVLNENVLLLGTCRELSDRNQRL